MLDLLSEAGTVKDTGQAPAALGLVDLAAFSGTVQPLSPWEACTLRAMSVAYLDGYNGGKDPASTAPWVNPDAVDKQGLQEKMSSIFDRLIATAKRE